MDTSAATINDAVQAHAKDGLAELSDAVRDVAADADDTGAELLSHAGAAVGFVAETATELAEHVAADAARRLGRWDRRTILAVAVLASAVLALWAWRRSRSANHDTNPSKKR